MDSNDKFYLTFLVLIIMIVVLTVGYVIGVGVGSDRIAERWCITLEYDDGRWSGNTHRGSLDSKLECSYYHNINREIEGE